MSWNHLLLTAVLLSTSLSYAHEEILCAGGINVNNQNFVKALDPKERVHDSELIGTLPTPQGTFKFSVRTNANVYHFKAQRMGSSWGVLIDEVVSEIPAMRSKILPERQEVYISCKPFSMADYCRLHAC